MAGIVYLTVPYVLLLWAYSPVHGDMHTAAIQVRNSATFYRQLSETLSSQNFSAIAFDTKSSYDSLNLTEPCKSQVILYGDSQMTESWAMSMYDSSTKFPDGLLVGHFQHLGNYDQCINVRDVSSDSGVFHGKHCLATLNLLPKTRSGASVLFLYVLPIKIAKCVPSSCTTEDVVQITDTDIETIKLLLTSMSMDVMVTVSELDCHTAETPELRGKDWVAIVVLIIFAVIVILSTSYDLFTENKDSRNNLALAFSAYTNGKKLLSVSKSGDVLHCLHGIRFISMAWVVFGHRNMNGILSPSTNLLTYYDDVLHDWRHLVVSNAVLAVDTFLLLSGLVCAYVFFRTVPKTNSFNIPLYYLHRYIRLTPVLAIMVMLQSTLWKYFGSGPIWDSTVGAEQDTCDDKWWTNLLYLQNYVKLPNQCLAQSWYLAVDMQLHWLSPIVLIPLWKWPKIGWALMGGVMLGGAVTNFVMSYENEFRGSYFTAILTVNGIDYSERMYWPVYARFMPYLIGIALGYILVDIKTKGRQIRLPKVVTLILWLLGLGLMLLTLCIIHVFQKEDYVFEPVGSSFYNSLGRPGWALGVALVIFLCATGYGGFPNTILSWDLFQILSKLCYSIYLVHQSLQMSQVGSMRVASHLGDIVLIPRFVSDLVLAIIFAVPLCLVFESPFIILEKELLGGKKPAAPKNLPGPTIPAVQETQQIEVPEEKPSTADKAEVTDVDEALKELDSLEEKSPGGVV